MLATRARTLYTFLGASTAACQAGIFGNCRSGGFRRHIQLYYERNKNDNSGEKTASRFGAISPTR